MENKIIQYITTQLIHEENTEITPDEDLITSGILDSLSTMKLVAFIEESFEVKVGPEELIIENFLDVNSMAAFIQEKKS